MTHGEQTLPINDLFVYLPVQLLPALVDSILHHGFDSRSEEWLGLPT